MNDIKNKYDVSRSYVKFDKIYFIPYFIYTHDHNVIFART